MNFFHPYAGPEGIHSPCDVVIEQNGKRYKVEMAEVATDGELIIGEDEGFEFIRRNVQDPVTPGIWTRHDFSKND